jgi:hypothetical protein
VDAACGEQHAPAKIVPFRRKPPRLCVNPEPGAGWQETSWTAGNVFIGDGENWLARITGGRKGKSVDI